MCKHPRFDAAATYRSPTDARPTFYGTGTLALCFPVFRPAVGGQLRRARGTAKKSFVASCRPIETHPSKELAWVIHKIGKWYDTLCVIIFHGTLNG